MSSVCCIVCTSWMQPLNQYPHYFLRWTHSWCISQWWTFDRISSLLMCLCIHARCWAPPLSLADAVHVLRPTWRGPRLAARSNWTAPTSEFMESSSKTDETLQAIDSRSVQRGRRVPAERIADSLSLTRDRCRKSKNFTGWLQVGKAGSTSKLKWEMII